MMRGNTIWWTIIIVLALVILGLIVVLVAAPAPSAPAPVATSTPVQTATIATSTEPLSAHVSLTFPKENETVAHTFDVSGQAPGNWSFEAQFPIQVRDSADNVIGRTTGNMQGNWQTTSLVAFKATMHVDDSYHGPAILILMKDNPSGLPENDDSVEIPIVIQ